ncbi:MAG: hypothetical protein ACRCT8_05155 [Lacipirellulaceae bacterium]
MIARSISLESTNPLDGKLPPKQLGAFLAVLPDVARGAVSMSLRSRSRRKGWVPSWLVQAADLRLVDVVEKDATIWFECPTIGEAAEEIYRQKSLFPELRPRPDETALDLLGYVIGDVVDRQSDSERFDRPLLRDLARFRKAVGAASKGPFVSATIGSREGAGRRIAIDDNAILCAESLCNQVPSPRSVRVFGRLDVIEASTQRFRILLESGQRVAGSFDDSLFPTISGLWNLDVAVYGKAVYRPSGAVLRIDAESMRAATEADRFFGSIPESRGSLDAKRLRAAQVEHCGIAAMMGRWPGDESDKQIAEALAEIE